MLNISKYCSIIDRCSSMYKNNSFKDIGICSSHAPFFFFLSKNPGATQEEISKRLVINKSNVTRSIQFLEEKGYVYKEIDATDKRINHIYLSDDGVKLVPIIRERIYVFNEAVGEVLNEEEIAVLNTLLEKVTKSAVNFVRKEDYVSWKWFLNILNLI